ncbi:2-phospho-L-lactate guanylyltransferase [Halobaculum sp. MBLA0147]|uniref:2-phospho-L-lactate guanylyltransferase n=1 Tax=Halobaculum sp. MBLA0147 TaxID=3079934 RepID=UPI0035245953
MRVLVPFAAGRPKTRLADVLDRDERRAFAEAMLSDVLAAVRAAGHTPELLTTERLDRDVTQTVDDRPLGTAVDAVLAERQPTRESPLGIVMADVPLATAESVRRLTGERHAGNGERGDEATSESTPRADLVFAPGLGGGTNAMVVAHPGFRTDYHGASIRDHRRVAARLDARVREVDSRRLATDVDDPADLAEVLLHADGAAHDWLVDAGFTVRTGDGRVGVERTG